MKLTAHQEAALAMADKLVHKQKSYSSAYSPKIGIWRGYAGVGKTTCLKQLIERHGAPILLAPTGKAALRVTEATAQEASTLHRWMYRPSEDPDTGEVVFAPKPLSELAIPDNHLIVVDEASMVSQKLWDDLLDAASYTNCNLLLCGDHFQLPPVDPEAKVPFSVLADDFECHARVDLTEIVRQALDSPIVRASLALRQGDVAEVRNGLPAVKGAEATWDYVKDFYAKTGEGAVLCHTNKMRHALNRKTRERLGMPVDLQPKEPLLVLRNTYECEVYNGEVIEFPGFSSRGKTVSFTNAFEPYQEGTGHFGVVKINGTNAVMSPEVVSGALQGFARKTLGSAAKDSLGKAFPKPPPAMRRGQRSFVPVLEANYGYTLTTHKSQGSEWNKVLVVVEGSVRLDTEEGHRWLYTAVTRAREECRLSWAGG